MMCFAAPLIAAIDHSTHWNADEYRFHSEKQFKIAKKIVKDLSLTGGESVLDIGCGDGKITDMIQSMVRKGKVVGIDISTSMIKHAKNTFPQVTFEEKDIYEMNYDHEFDLVVSFSTMQWVTDQKRALKLVHRALKKGGRVVISMPQEIPPPLQRAVDKVKSEPRWQRFFEGYSPNWRFYEVAEYRALLEGVGFTIESISPREIPDSYPNRHEFMAFLDQWFPYLTEIPSAEEKRLFLRCVVDQYLKNAGMETGQISFPVKGLNAVGRAR